MKTYIVDTATVSHPVRVKASANRNKRRLNKRLRNRFAGVNPGMVMKREAGRKTVYVLTRGESFTVKREAERFARKHGGTVYTVAF